MLGACLAVGLWRWAFLDLVAFVALGLGLSVGLWRWPFLVLLLVY
jgi:hypothetical protein